MTRSSGLLSWFRIALKALVVGNGVFALFLLTLLATSLGAPEFFGSLMGGTPGLPAPVLAALRVLILVGLASVPLSHLILTRLIAIVDTVRDGDPFVAENAARLGGMAWAMLGLQLLGLVAIAAAVGGSGDGHRIDWHFSFTGWLAVLMLFVLARVFAQGARMREDLEGTV